MPAQIPAPRPPKAPAREPACVPPPPGWPPHLEPGLFPAITCQAMSRRSLLSHSPCCLSRPSRGTRLLALGNSNATAQEGDPLTPGSLTRPFLSDPEGKPWSHYLVLQPPPDRCAHGLPAFTRTVAKGVRGPPTRIQDAGAASLTPSAPGLSSKERKHTHITGLKLAKSQGPWPPHGAYRATNTAPGRSGIRTRWHANGQAM